MSVFQNTNTMTMNSNVQNDEEMKKQEEILKSELPRINTNAPYAVCVHNLMYAIKKSNYVFPWIFQYNDQLIRIEYGMKYVSELDVKELKHVLSEKFIILGKNSDGYIQCPTNLAEYCLRNKHLFPKIEQILNNPVLLPDGEFTFEIGFDEENAVYTLPSATLPSNFGDKVSAFEVDEAVQYLNQELLGDFNFADDHSRVHALVGLIQPFLRYELRDQNNPAYLVSADDVCAGKSSLCSLLAHVSTGENHAILGYRNDEKEMDRIIASQVASSNYCVIFDNIKGQSIVNSECLARMLSNKKYTARRMYKTETQTHTVDLLVLMNGVNVILGEDLKRRVLPINLRKSNKVYSDFRHPNFEEYIAGHRVEIQHAIATILRYWHECGRPMQDMNILPSFEAWSRQMGGILDLIGLGEHFLGHLKKNETKLGEQLLSCIAPSWWNKFESRRVKANQVLPLLDWISSNHGYDNVSIGVLLAAYKDCMIGSRYCLRSVHKCGSNSYWLEEVALDDSKYEVMVVDQIPVKMNTKVPTKESPVIYLPAPTELIDEEPYEFYGDGPINLTCY